MKKVLIVLLHTLSAIIKRILHININVKYELLRVTQLRYW